MKRQFKIAGLLVGILLLISACGAKKPEPADAATVFMNTEFYQKDEDKYNDYFGVTVDNSTESIKKDFNDIIKTFGLSDENSDKIFTDILSALKQKTTYKIGKINEKDDLTTIDINVYGLDTSDFEGNITKLASDSMLKKLNDAGIKVNSMDDLTNLSDDASIEKANELLSDPTMIQTMLDDILLQAFKNTKQNKTPKKIVLTLEQNKKNKKQWSVVDREKTINNIGQALIPVN